MRVLLDGSVRVAVTERVDGDFAIDAVDVGARRRAVIDRPWSWVRQVHGDACVVVDQPGAAAGESADALLTEHPEAVISVQTADCVPVALLSTTAVGVAHAGWRGLVGGVLDRAVERLRSGGAGSIEAVVGPHIRPHCYEFGAEDLARAADELGAGVIGRSSLGTSALDLTAGVFGRLERLGVAVAAHDERCTCDEQLFSHRCRQDRERMAMVVYRP